MQQSMTSIRSQRGFTLLEVTMALAVLGIGIMSIVALQTRDAMYNNSSRRQTQAYTWALDRVERLRSISYADVKSSTSDVKEGPYSISWTVKDDTQPDVVKDTKQVSVVVKWNGKVMSNVLLTKSDDSI